MITVKMNRNKHGSPDGFTVNHYEEGKEYELPDGLADVFMKEGVAEKVAEKAEKAPKNKAEKVAENKSA